MTASPAMSRSQEALDALGVNVTRVHPDVITFMSAALEQLDKTAWPAFIAMAPTDYTDPRHFTDALLAEFTSSYVATYADSETFARMWVNSQGGESGAPLLSVIEAFIDYAKVCTFLNSPWSGYTLIGDAPVHVFLRVAPVAVAARGSDAHARDNEDFRSLAA